MDRDAGRLQTTRKCIRGQHTPRHIQGDNEIAVELVSTLRNLLGPHHRPEGEPEQCWNRDYVLQPAWLDDPETLAAIAYGLDGLAGLSRERVGHEMLKLLRGNPAKAYFYGDDVIA